MERSDQYDAHFNVHDAEKLSNIYAANCDVVHDDKTMSDRTEVQREYENFFLDNPDVTTEFRDVKIRVVSPTVAIESGTWHDSNHSKPGLSTHGTYSSVYKLRDGEWEIVVERAWAKKDGPLSSLPIEDVPEIGDYLLGQWAIKGTSQGESAVGSMVVTAASDGLSHHLDWTVESGGMTKHGSGIGGVSPTTGGVVEYGFISNGDWWINRYDGEPLGDLGASTGTRVGMVSGQPVDAKITVDRVSKDEFTYKVGSEENTRAELTFSRIHGTVAKADAARELIGHLRGGTWQMVEPNLGTEDSYAPILGGRFTRFYSTGNEQIPPTVGILGTHPQTEKLMWWTFRNDGSVALVPTTIIRKSSAEFKTVIGGANQPINLDIDFTIDSPDRSTLITVGDVDGGKIPENNTWERRYPAESDWVNSDPPNEIPDALSNLKYITGPRWLTLKSAETGKGTGSSMGRWILDGKFFLYSANAVYENGDDWGHCFVLGRDPESGCYKGWEFGSSGSVGEFILSDDGMSLEGSLMERDSSGEVAKSFQGTFSLEGNVWKYSAKIGSEGETATPYQWTWRDAGEE